MSESIRVSGKTVEDAITNATIQLGVTSDRIEYTVIEHETRGFLGFGARDAVIEVRKKEIKSDEELLKEAELEKAELAKAEALKEKKEKKAADDKKASSAKPVQEKKSSSSASESAKNDSEPAKKAQAAKEENKVKEKVKASEKTVEKSAPEEIKKDEAPKAAAASEDAPATKEESQELRERRPRRETVPLEDPSEAIEKAEKFLTDVYKSMGMEAELKSVYDGEILNIQMKGDDMGILIGKRGQTLDSLQYLTSLVVNKNSPSYVRVKLDTENYRERRKATLENLAKNIAVKVKKNRNPVYLEPMNPYERRIIHSALQDDPFVTTHSEGDEPERKVVVTLKKDADLDALDRKYSDNRGRGQKGSYRDSRSGRPGRKGSYRRRDYEKKDRDYSEQANEAEDQNRENIQSDSVE